jgi:hypothetical protein
MDRPSFRLLLLGNTSLGLVLLGLGKLYAGLFLMVLSLVLVISMWLVHGQVLVEGRGIASKDKRTSQLTARFGVTSLQVVACGLMGMVCFVGGAACLVLLVLRGGDGWRVADLLVGGVAGLSLGSLCLYGAAYVLMSGRSDSKGAPNSGVR